MSGLGDSTTASRGTHGGAGSHETSAGAVLVGVRCKHQPIKRGHGAASACLPRMASGGEALEVGALKQATLQSALGLSETLLPS